MIFLSNSKFKYFLVVISFLVITVSARYYFIGPLPGLPSGLSAVNSSVTKSTISQIQPADCDFRVIAHRGNSYTFPEDTALSIDSAFKNGANMVEVDVRLDREGVPILMHDALLDRTTNGSGPVSNWSLAMLKTLDAGSWKGAKFSGTEVPSLAGAIKAAAGRGPLYLDIKVPDLQEPLARMLREYNFPADSIYPAVNSDSMLKQYHQALPNTPLIWFRDIPKDWNESWFDYLIEQGVVGLELFWPTVQRMPGAKKLLAMARRKNLDVWVYVINDRVNMQRVIEKEINGIETDRPDFLHNVACGDGKGRFEKLNRIMGHWDFVNGTLVGTIGFKLRHWGQVPSKAERFKIDFTENFNIPFLNGKNRKVLFVPKLNQNLAIQLLPGLHPYGPGSGSRVNQYSLLLDILRPTENEGKKQALIQTNPRNRNLAEIYIHENGGIGDSKKSFGHLASNRWYRLVIAVDLLAGEQGEAKLYLDGAWQGTLKGNGVDGKYSVPSNVSSSPILLFTDVEGSSESIYVAAVQLMDHTLNANEVRDIGSITRNGPLVY